MMFVEPHMFDKHRGKFGASAQRVVADADQRRIAKPGQRYGGRIDDRGSDPVRQAAHLFRSARSLASSAAEREAHNVGLSWSGQILVAMRESDSAETAFDGGDAVPLNLAVDELCYQLRICGQPIAAPTMAPVKENTEIGAIALYGANGIRAYAR